MRAPTGMAQLIAQTENNLIKELPLRGSWHGAAVTEGVNRASRARYRNFCKISDSGFVKNRIILILVKMA